MSVGAYSETLGKKQPCFSSCLTVKGMESSKVTKVQKEKYQNGFLRMWAPTKSVAVKPPVLEVTGTSVIPFTNRDEGTVEGDFAPSQLSHQEHIEGNGKDIRQENILLFLGSSTDKQLSSEYNDFIPRRLMRPNTSSKPSQFGELSAPSFGSSRGDHILPQKLKFGIRNAANLPHRQTGIRQGVDKRPRAVVSLSRANLEPLLLSEKPAENLHEELEREEIELNNRDTASKSTAAKSPFPLK